MELQKSNNNQTTLSIHSLKGLGSTLAAGRFDQVMAIMPTTVAGALESPRICDLIREAGRESVYLLVEAELIRVSRMVNTGGNLHSGQPQELARELVDLYPSENIGDFRACFHGAVMRRKYGEVVRLDAPTIAGWFARYLEDKYEELENQLHRQKDNLYEIPKKADSDPDFNVWEEFKKVHGTVGQKIAPMSKGMIVRNGQDQPPQKKGTGAVPMTEDEAAAWYRKQYPTATEEQIKTLIYTGRL